MKSELLKVCRENCDGTKSSWFSALKTRVDGWVLEERIFIREHRRTLCLDTVAVWSQEQ